MILDDISLEASFNLYKQNSDSLKYFYNEFNEIIAVNNKIKNFISKMHYNEILHNECYEKKLVKTNKGYCIVEADIISLREILCRDFNNLPKEINEYYFDRHLGKSYNDSSQYLSIILLLDRIFTKNDNISTIEKSDNTSIQRWKMDFGEVDNICSGIILLIWKKQPFYTIFKFVYDKKFKFKTDLVDFTTSQEDFIENLKENLKKNGLKECFSSNLNLCYFKYEFGKLLEIKRDEILSGKNVVFVEDDGNINWLFGDGALDVLGLEE